MIGVSPRQALCALTLFGLSFGFIEATLVVYARYLAAPLREAAGLVPDDLFPLLVGAKAVANPLVKRVATFEMFREAATLVLLWSAGLAIGRDRTSRFAAFLLAFGVWDLSYYLSLKLLIGWPASIMEPDILFLLPQPWWAPVLAPVLAAVTMAVFGALYLCRPFATSPAHWALIILGGAMMTAAFVWDATALAAGAVPRQFNWPLYLAGWGLAASAAAHAARRRVVR